MISKKELILCIEDIEKAASEKEKLDRLYRLWRAGYDAAREDCIGMLNREIDVSYDRI